MPDMTTAALPTTATALLTAIAPHPRLLLTDQGLSDLQAHIASNVQAAELAAAVHLRAQRMMAEPVLERVLIGSKRFRLLETSRLCLARVLAMGLSHRLRPDNQLRARIVAELQAVCAFVDWYPEHFLDTAEMTTAVAIGYDWLYHEFTDDQRTALLTSLTSLGLNECTIERSWWTARNNWGQVCHGSAIIGALATAEHHPQLARDMIARGLSGMPTALASYPDSGAFPEGPTYWDYGTAFTIMTAASLTTALGHDCGLTEHPGFRASFTWVVHAHGPMDLPFNVGDCGLKSPSSPWHAWAGTAWNHPDWHSYSQQRLATFTHDPHLKNRFIPLTLVWHAAAIPCTLPTMWSASGASPMHMALFRSSWKDPHASYTGIKCGSPQLSHGHLDIGAFIFDADGQRWAEDLGMEKEIYDRIDSWGLDQKAHRWDFFRANNFSHNTFTLNGAIQRVAHSSPLLFTHEDDDEAYALADLTAAYAGQATAVRRGIALVNERRDFFIRDEIIQPTGSVCWNMLTQAQVTMDATGRTAILRLGAQTRILRVLEAPPELRLEIAPATPPTAAEHQNDGYQCLRLIGTPDPTQQCTIALLIHRESGPATTTRNTPLAGWTGKRGVTANC